MAGQDQMRVRWRTTESALGSLRYGTSIDELNLEVSESEATLEHSIHLPDLQPGTRYYYAVTSAGKPLTEPGERYTFKTAPDFDTQEGINVWVLGDPGTGDANQKGVRDAYYENAETTSTDLILVLGDNAYSNGTDFEYQAHFFDIYADIFKRTSVWPAFGNNDGKSADSATQTGAYFDAFNLPTKAEFGGVASHTEAYYSFDYGPVHFICLDTAESDLSKDGVMAGWLREDLQAARARPWIIAYAHHAPYSHGTYDTDRVDPKAGRIALDVRENLVPILEAGDTDLFLTGHSHVYERSYLMSGHYGVSSTLKESMILDRDPSSYKKSARKTAGQGTLYAVVGSSGKTKKAPLDHPAMAFSSNSLGSLTLNVTADTLQASFLDETGRITDTFSIEKTLESR